jgi:hypothetical protein
MTRYWSEEEGRFAPPLLQSDADAVAARQH